MRPLIQTNLVLHGKGVKDVNRGPNLLPKDLISKYQLDQSQIAFTLCTQFPNRPMRIHPETTVYSTIITEASTLKKTTGKYSTNIRSIISIFSPSLQIQLAHPLVNISFSLKLTFVFSVESTADIRCPHCDHPIKTETPTESDASTKPRSTNTKASRVRRRRQVCIKHASFAR